jgi:hypothetical protein
MVGREFTLDCRLNPFARNPDWFVAENSDLLLMESEMEKIVPEVQP